MPKRLGKASYYDLPRNRMANGHMFDANAMNAAMLHVPLGTVVQVTNIATKKTISVAVTDRGPYPPGRVIDLPKAAFTALAGGTGTGLVEVEVDVP